MLYAKRISIIIDLKYILLFMDFYVAKDRDGIGFFKDKPDLVKFSSTDPIVWEGYPVDFGDFTQIRDLVTQHPSVSELDEYDPPVHLYIDDIVFNVL